MITIEKVLHTGRTHTLGGRDGEVRSDDGRLAVELSPPGAPGDGTNPEQLLAAAWSASLLGTLRQAASARRIAFPVETVIAAEVDLSHGENGFFLRARFVVELPGIAVDVAQQLVAAAHGSCPYSKATRGNIEVAIEIG